MYQKISNPLKVLLLTFLFSIHLDHTNAQSTKADSILSVLPSAKGAERCGLLLDLSLEYVGSDITKALSYINQTYDCSTPLGDSLMIVKSGRIKGQILRRLDRIPEAIEIFEKVLPIARRNKYSRDYTLLLNSIALAYTFQGSFDAALQYHFESLVIREEEGDKEGLSVTLNNIGLVYYKIKNYEKAIEYYMKSLSIKDEIRDNFDLDILLINIGVSYIQLGQYSEAEKYIQRAFKTCNNNCKPEIQVMGYYGLGMVAFELKDYSTARDYFERSLEKARASNNKRFQAENLVDIARIALAQNALSEAYKFLVEAQSLTTEIEYVDIRERVLKNFIDYYERYNDFKSVSSYQSKYIQLRDSVYTDKLIKNLASVQTNYEERENLKTIRDKDAILELKEDLIKRQRAQYVFIVVITILVFGLAAVMYWANRRQRLTNIELASAKNQIEEINKQLAMQNVDLDKQVRERTEELHLLNNSLQQVNSELDNFIYKTSHDIRGPLATLKGMSHIAIMEIKEPLAIDYLKKIEFTADRLTDVLHRLSTINQINHSVLNPVPINFKSLIEDIRKKEESKGWPANLEFKSEVQPGVMLISDFSLVEIILTNLIDNAIKFHNESNSVPPFVHITISKVPGFAAIRVADNGIGLRHKDKSKIFQMFMRASERSQTGGVGLYLSKSATEKLGGEIILESTSENGSVFFVKLPEDLNLIIARRAEEEKKLADQRDALTRAGSTS